MFSFVRRTEVAQLSQDIEKLKGQFAITLGHLASLTMVLGATLSQMNKGQRDSLIEALKTEVGKGTSTGAPDSMYEKYKQVYMDAKSGALQNFIETVGSI
jgi:hypothetical protein